MNSRYPATLPGHDALSRLARSDPRSFETLRLELIESCIDDAPEPIQLRLRQLQFRIDSIRRRSRSPWGATVKINSLMWDSLLEMNDELQKLRPENRAPLRPEPTRRSADSAKVLEFGSGAPGTPRDDRR